MKVVAQNTDLRASFALPTVKKRIRMCGRPAVPNISAMPSEIAEIGLATAAPGSMILSCWGWTSIALAISALKSKPNCASTSSAISVAPTSSSAALMICTQVVAIMPPKVT